MKEFEKKVHSQAGQDGVVEHIFDVIGTANKFFVDIGAGNGVDISNTYNLREQGWDGVCLDAVGCLDVHQEFVTASNVQHLLTAYRVPSVFDYLTIDIDGNDFWIWKAITKWFPQVVSVEFNSNHDANKALTIPYHPDRKWDGTWYFGASLAALWKLGLRKGYSLVHIVDNLDAFFVRTDIVSTSRGQLVSRTPKELLPVPIPCFARDDRVWQSVV